MYPYIDVYPGVSRSGHHHYHHPTIRPLGAHNRYYNALAEARAAWSEMLAEEAARREEELQPCHLQELCQSRLASQPHSHQLHCYHPYHADTLAHPSYLLSHLETFRLQRQEEQLVRLGALRKKRLELEEEAKLAAVVELQHRKLQELSRRETARHLFRELEIAEQEASFSQLGYSSPFGTTRAPASTTPQPSGITSVHSFVQYPHHDIVGTSDRKPDQSAELLVHLTPGEPRHTGPPIRHIEQVQRDFPQIRKEDWIGASAIPNSVDLNYPLQQLGLFEPAHETCPREGERTNHMSKGKDSSSQLPQSSTEAILKEQPEKHFNSEYANEIRDTAKALLNSFNDLQPVPTSAQFAYTSQLSVPESLKSSFKGKSKEDPPTTEEQKRSSIRGVDNTLLQVQEVEKRFRALETEFVFPHTLDFIAPTSTKAGSVTSYLTYTASNHPVRFYEQSLNQLLIQLDSIESHGNEQLRNKRKDVVRKVEHALEDLEQEVEGRWKSKLTKGSKRRGVTVEDVTSTGKDPDAGLGSKFAEKIGEALSANPTRVPIQLTGGIPPSPPHEHQPCVGERSVQVPVVEEPTVEKPAGLEYSASIAALSTREVSVPAVQETVLETPPTGDVSSNTSEILPAQPLTSLEPEPSMTKARETIDADLQEITEESNEDPSTTTAPSSEPTGSPLLDSQMKSEVGEPKGFLLDHDSVEGSSDISDARSTLSDWSEVGTTATQ